MDLNKFVKRSNNDETFYRKKGTKKNTSSVTIIKTKKTQNEYGAAKQQTINISHIIIIIKAKDRGTFNQQCQYKFTFFGYYKMRISNERGFY